MYKILQLPEFENWLKSIKDPMTKIRLSRRLDKAQRGNLGDIRAINHQVFEMREFFGPGWRMYYVQYNDVLIVMLGGGDKSSQTKDIHKAIKLAQLLEKPHD